ncbi:MAG: hypothetical protein ABFD92_07750 [Planctomycetaceae bacterium]|nr:hypothetical protein [Planctomycetaceae bacterium]
MADNVNIEAVERNQDRASCAQAAVEAYAGLKVNNTTDMWDFESESQQERLTDLLSDLRHWACQNELNFDESVRISESHFNCEVDEEAEVEEPEGGDGQ